MSSTDPLHPLGHEERQAPQRKPRLVSRIAAVGAVVGLIGVGGVAVQAAMSDPSAPSGPEDAVTTFMEALANEDLAGMVEVLDPYERDSLINPTRRVTGELGRLGVLEADDARYPSIDVVDFTLDGLSVEAHEITPGLVEVRFTAGTLTTTVDPDWAPAGFSPTDHEAVTAWGELPQTINFGHESIRLITIERDGSWYVTGYYTLAESIRRDRSGPVPVIDGGPLPVGSATADQVIPDVVAELVVLDAEGVLTMLDPHEAAVLYDYAPIYLDDAQTALGALGADASDNFVIEQITTNAREMNGRTVVSLSELTMALNRDGDAATVRYADGCITISEPMFYEEEICASGRTGIASDTNAAAVWERLQRNAGLTAQESETLQRLGTTLAELETGVTVIERDGRWYLSLMPNLLDTAADYLAVVEPADVDVVTGAISKLIASMDAITVNDLSYAYTPGAQKFVTVTDTIASQD